MDQLIKHSGGTFQKALLLVLIPVMIITCYSFYVSYGGLGLDYSKITSVDINSALQGNMEAIDAFSSGLINMLPQSAAKQTFSDFLLKLINILIIVFLDAFIIVMGYSLMQDKKLPTNQMFKQALQKMPSILIISMFSSWLIYEIESIIYSGIFVTFAFFKTANPILMYVSAFMLINSLAFAILLSCWFLLYIRYMAIAVASSRCRLIFALGYAKSVLKGNVWRQMLHIAPFIILGFVLPVSLQAVAIALSKDIYIMLVLVAISALLQVVAFAHMWMYTIPEFFTLELHSGIQQKIREAFNRAMNINNNKQDKNENNTNDDIEPKE